MAPTADRLRTAMFVLCALGLGIAGYLTYVHYAGGTALCASGGCEQVQTSPYSRLAGLPVALLGQLAYATIAGLLVTGDNERTWMAVLGVAAVGLGFSLYLTYREVFTLQALCPWCVASAAIMALLFGLTTRRFLQDSAD
jgi:uncharacterized membrane protein